MIVIITFDWKQIEYDRNFGEKDWMYKIGAEIMYGNTINKWMLIFSKRICNRIMID